MSKSCFTFVFSCSSSSKEVRFRSDVLHTSCASAGWFSLENIPKAATPAKAFDAKLRRVKSFIPLLHFTCTGMSSSRNLLDRSLGAAFHTAPTESPRTSCGQDSFKITPRLTIDYGVRWDYYGLPYYTDNLGYNWDRNTGPVVVSPTSLLTLVIAFFYHCLHAARY